MERFPLDRSRWVGRPYMSACPSSQSKVLNRRLGNLLIGNRVADSVQEGSKRRNHVGMSGANCGVRLALQFALKLARRIRATPLTTVRAGSRPAKFQPVRILGWFCFIRRSMLHLNYFTKNCGSSESLRQNCEIA